MSGRLEIVGIALCLIGWINAIVTCALPMWRITTFPGSNIIPDVVIWEGIWVSCAGPSTGMKQCEAVLLLPTHLQAARTMTVISIIVAVLSLTVYTMSRYTSYINGNLLKRIVMIISGVFLIIAGLLVLIPVSWTSNNIDQDFLSTLVFQKQNRELGASLYTGFIAAILLIIGGALLCCTRPPKERGQRSTIQRWF